MMMMMTTILIGMMSVDVSVSVVDGPHTIMISADGAMLLTMLLTMLMMLPSRVDDMLCFALAVV